MSLHCARDERQELQDRVKDSFDSHVAAQGCWSGEGLGQGRHGHHRHHQHRKVGRDREDQTRRLELRGLSCSFKSFMSFNIYIYLIHSILIRVLCHVFVMSEEMYIRMYDLVSLRM